MTHGLTRVALTLGATLAMAVTGCGGDDNGVTNPPGPTRELQSGNFMPGQSYSHAFANAGTYPYTCTLHSSAMNGTVIVDASAAAGDTMETVNIPGLSFDPVSVTIAPGGRVLWTNNDPVTTRAHNVTSTP